MIDALKMFYGGSAPIMRLKVSDIDEVREERGELCPAGSVMRVYAEVGDI